MTWIAIRVNFEIVDSPLAIISSLAAFIFSAASSMLLVMIILLYRVPLIVRVTYGITVVGLVLTILALLPYFPPSRHLIEDSGALAPVAFMVLSSGIILNTLLRIWGLSVGRKL